MATTKIVIARGERRFELEGTREEINERFQSLFDWVNASPPESQDTSPPAGGDEKPAERTTLRTFLKSKAPVNTYEAIATVLHYERTHGGRDELSPEEIRTCLIQGGHRPPNAMGQALTDCKRRYGYIDVGSRKGSWKLSHQGETLVELDLPRNRE
jgi:hypothetical protein